MTYYLPQHDETITNPEIVKNGYFGYLFENNVSGDFVAHVDLVVYPDGNKTVFDLVLKYPAVEAPKVLNSQMTDEARASLIDAWIMEKLVEFIV